jgi:hypothetical protein
VTNGEERIFQKLHALGVAGQRPEKLFLKKQDDELKASLRFICQLLIEAWLALYPDEKPKDINFWHD